MVPNSYVVCIWRCLPTRFSIQPASRLSFSPRSACFADVAGFVCSDTERRGIVGRWKRISAAKIYIIYRPRPSQATPLGDETAALPAAHLHSLIVLLQLQDAVTPLWLDSITSGTPLRLLRTEFPSIRLGRGGIFLTFCIPPLQRSFSVNKPSHPVRSSGAKRGRFCGSCDVSAHTS